MVRSREGEDPSPGSLGSSQAPEHVDLKELHTIHRIILKKAGPGTASPSFSKGRPGVLIIVLPRASPFLLTNLSSVKWG